MKIIKEKRHLFLFCLVIALVLIPIPALAMAEDTFPDDFDKSSISSEIYTWIASETITEETNGENISSSVNVDFSKAYKIYIETNIFDLQSNNFGEVKQQLEAGGFMYEVPVNFGQYTFLANVSRGIAPRPEASAILSEAEIADLNEKVGKWVVPGGGLFDAENPFVDYYERVYSIVGSSGEKPIFVGGLPYFRYAVALFPDDNGDIGKIVPVNIAAVDWEGLNLNYDNPSPILEYSIIKEYILKHPEPIFEESYSGGGGSSLPFDEGSSNSRGNAPLFLIVALIAITGIALLVIKTMKKKPNV